LKRKSFSHFLVRDTIRLIDSVVFQGAELQTEISERVQMSFGRLGCRLFRRDYKKGPQFGCPEGRWSVETGRRDAPGVGPDGSTLSATIGFV